MATRPRRASWATFVAVHIVVQLQTAEMAILVWYTKPVQNTHFVLIQHFYVKEQISAAPLPGQTLCNQSFLIHHSNTGVHEQSAMVPSHGAFPYAVFIQDSVAIRT